MNRLLGRRGFVKASAMGTAAAMLPPLWAQTTHYDVIVVGAGLSGLHTAYLLEQQGCSVLLLESSHRLGGRVYTLDHLEGRPDAGGMQIGANYQELRSIAARLNISLNENAGAQSNGALSVRGALIHPQEWSGHPANRLSEEERHLQPGFLRWKYLAEIGALQNPDEWLNQEYRYLDTPLSTYLKDLGASEEALRLMNSNFESDDLSEVSTLHTLRKFSVIVQSGASEFVAEGTSRIPEAMSRSLKAEPLLNKRVSAIIEGDDQLIVSCTDGSRYQANCCVLATPFSTVRNMDLQLPLSDLKRQAINGLAYNHIAQVYLRPKSNFWETDGFTPDVWTDGPVGMVTAEKDQDDNILMLRAWLFGENARALEGLSRAEISERVIADFEAMRPSAKGQLSMAELVDWGASPDSLGAYAHFYPGDVGRFAAVIAEPEGRLYFAGEHTEFQKSGMEAAVVSARRCAQEVMASLKR